MFDSEKYINRILGKERKGKLKQDKSIQIQEPKPEVELIDQSGNAFYILGAVQRSLRHSKLYTEDEVQVIMKEMRAGDYDHLLQTAMKYCEVI